ncbi:MAG: DUF1376 domain-containing protein [Nitrosomonas sp.]|nr:MAG: DUF1376 domain-containing protein [Nitrosomonas sp.]
MHYFKMNIGDYAKKAGRLSMLEHGAYTLLMQACYDRERFPTLGDAYDWCWVRTEDEKRAVEFVLNKFFTLEGDFYVQKRIQEEIEKYHENSRTNRRIATEREEKRRNKTRTVNEACTNRDVTVNEPPPNQEPITKNQEPINKNHTFERGSKTLKELGANQENKNALEKKPNSVVQNVHLTPIPEDFEHDSKAELLSKQFELDITIEKEMFIAHYKANGEQRSDWNACFRKWLMRSMQRNAEQKRQSQAPPSNQKSNKFNKFSGFDYVSGGDGYGGKREEVIEGELGDEHVAIPWPKAN